MKKILLAGLLLFVLSGCKSKIPKDVIPPDQMSKILYDIHVVDGYINVMPSQDSARKVASAYYKGIYKKFGIDSASYTHSMNFYQKNPEVMSEMYATIKADMEKEKTKVEKENVAFEKKRAKLLQDSLKADSVKKVKLEKDSLLRKTKKQDSIRKSKRIDSAVVKKKVVKAL